MVSLFDPLLRAPLWGCSALGWTCGLVGASLYLRRQSLLGETLSHATYPGLMLCGLLASLLGIDEGLRLELFAALGAFLFGWIGIYDGECLVRRGFSSDVASSWVLSSYMGLGIALASLVQTEAPRLYMKMQTLLLGQAATLQDQHLLLYGALALLTTLFCLLLYRPLLAFHFDAPFFSHLEPARARALSFVLFSLWTLALVFGLRGAGVVLMPALLVCPAVCAAQMTQKAPNFLFLSALQGALFSWVGVLTGFEIEHLLARQGYAILLPTGPIIVLIATLWSALVLLFSPKKGLLAGKIRRSFAQKQCIEEDILKALYQHQAYAGKLEQSTDQPKELPFVRLERQVRARSCYIRDVLENLMLQRLVQRRESNFYLTPRGKQRAERIVELHTLWTLYLTRELEMALSRDLRLDLCADQIELILDPETKKELRALLKKESLQSGASKGEEESKRGLPCFSR